MEVGLPRAAELDRRALLDPSSPNDDGCSPDVAHALRVGRGDDEGFRQLGVDLRHEDAAPVPGQVRREGSGLEGELGGGGAPGEIDGSGRIHGDGLRFLPTLAAVISGEVGVSLLVQPHDERVVRALHLVLKRTVERKVRR